MHNITGDFMGALLSERWLVHGDELSLVEVCVHPLRGNEFVMRTDFDDPAMIEHDDARCIAHGRQPMGYDKTGATAK